jgi:hypothetical protein
MDSAWIDLLNKFAAILAGGTALASLVFALKSGVLKWFRFGALEFKASPKTAGKPKH